MGFRSRIIFWFWPVVWVLYTVGYITFQICLLCSISVIGSFCFAGAAIGTVQLLNIIIMTIIVERDVGLEAFFNDVPDSIGKMPKKLRIAISIGFAIFCPLGMVANDIDKKCVEINFYQKINDRWEYFFVWIQQYYQVSLVGIIAAICLYVLGILWLSIKIAAGIVVIIAFLFLALMALIKPCLG